MDSDWVVDQTRVYLIHPLREYLKRMGTPGYVSGDSFVYYDPDRPPVGPDYYVVRGGAQRGQTKWVVWEEQWLMPTTVIEFLSPSTETRDRGEKFCIYRDALQVEDYVLVDQQSLQLEVYRLNRGHYVSQAPGEDGWYFLPSLNLHLGVVGEWIRLRTPAGDILLSGQEQAEQERARAEAERSRAESERSRADEERSRAESERSRADQLEVEKQQLLEELRRMRDGL